MIPVYSFIEGDVIGLLLLAYQEETAETLKRKMLQAARTRVCPEGEFVLQYKGRDIESSKTVGELNLKPLDRLDLRIRRNI